MTPSARLFAALCLAGTALAQPAPAQEADLLTSLNPLSGLDLQTLAATRTLPLFTPTRSPPVEEPPPVPEALPVEPPPIVEPPPPPALRLVGVVMTEADKMALLADQATGTIHRLRSGDVYEGWTLTTIDGRSVAFSLKGREHVLTMFEEFGAVPAPPLLGEEPLVIPEPE